jgi:hypothetical protein
MRTLAIWERHYPSEQIHVGFLDAISSDPAAYLRTVYDFLDLDGEHFPPDLEEARNVSAPAAMPPRIASYLARRYLPLCAALDERFSNEYTARWLADTEALLET